MPRHLAAPPPEPVPQDSAAPAPRDPFAAPPVEDAALSRRYVLTGLTRTAGGPVATINDRDYAIGDRLGALTIIAIDDAEVTLASGTQQLRLRLGRPG